MGKNICTIIDEAKITPVIKACDVLVAGGGIAGISAALAAARNGTKVILIEKQCALGGLATLGLITVYLPLCDGMGNQVIYGIGEELLKLSIEHGYEAFYPKAWLEHGTFEEKKAKRYEVRYNAQLFSLSSEKLLLDEGVEIIYDTRITSVHKTDASIDAIIVDNKEGHLAIQAKTVIDATGDADICFFSGEKVEVNDRNKLALWYYCSGQNGIKLRTYPWPQEQLYKNRDYYNGVKTDDVNRMIIDGHNELMFDILHNRKNKNDESIMPVTMPMVPEFRMTRRLAGKYEMQESEVHLTFEDSIGMTGDWRKRGPVFNIPFRCLYGEKVKNLITAGRCISVKDDMWDITRVIPTCAVTGEAAGTAAGLLVQNKLQAYENLNINELQKQLKIQGVKINEDFLSIQSKY